MSLKRKHISYHHHSSRTNPSRPPKLTYPQHRTTDFPWSRFGQNHRVCILPTVNIVLAFLNVASNPFLRRPAPSVVVVVTSRSSHFRDSTFSVTEAAGSVLIHELLAGKHTTRTFMIQTRSVQLLSQLIDHLPFQTDIWATLYGRKYKLLVPYAAIRFR